MSADWLETGMKKVQYLWHNTGRQYPWSDHHNIYDMVHVNFCSFLRVERRQQMRFNNFIYIAYINRVTRI